MTNHNCQRQSHNRHNATRLSFTPDNIYSDGNGRWIFDGDDVTDMPVWWACAAGHSFQATIPARISGTTCPHC